MSNEPRSESHYENGTLTMTRTYDAPVAAVFEAWVETSKVEQWWGCKQTTNVKSDIEKKVGGKYNHVMTIQGAGEYPMTCRITAYDPPNLLAYEDASDDPNPMRVTIRFTSKGDQTEVRLVHENLPDNLSEIVNGGWTAALGKLHDLLVREMSEAN